MAVQDDVAQVDAYLRSAKWLHGHQPHWEYQSGYKDWQISWPVCEADGTTRSHLRLRVARAVENLTVVLIFRKHLIARMDLVADDECEPNPPQAAALGLPARVCGLHLHSWEANRSTVLATERWELPVREPVREPLTTLDNMLRWFCERYGITIADHSGPLEPPPPDLLR